MALKPQSMPSCLLKVRVASTIRASIITCGTGRVEALDEVEDGRQVLRQLLDDQEVRPGVDEDVSPRRHDLLGGRRGGIRGRVGELLDDRLRRAVVLLRPDELLALSLLGRELRGRGDPHHVPLEDVPEAVDLQDQLERLVPGDVGEGDRDGAADVGVEDDVQVRQLAELLERVLDVGVLEVQREGLARVLPLGLADRAGLERVRDVLGLALRVPAASRASRPPRGGRGRPAAVFLRARAGRGEGSSPAPRPRATPRRSSARGGGATSGAAATGRAEPTRRRGGAG